MIRFFTCHGPRMRATQVMPREACSKSACVNWMAHTPVGHDNFTLDLFDA